MDEKDDLQGLRKNMTNKDLKEKANKIRAMVLALAYHAGGAHISPAFSMAEVLSVLFYKEMDFSPENMDDPDRDRFILSKGHACAGLYCVLADCGFFSVDELKNVSKKDSILGGHPDSLKIPGVEASTGSLGHGFSIACGVAFAGKLQKKDYRVYTVLGDGECQEGSIWEAAMFASQRKLDNLIAIVDYNKLQGMGRIDDISSLEVFTKKWESFGWDVADIDGHDIDQIESALSDLGSRNGRPGVIIANTIKGKGVSFMENKAIWHYRMPDENEMKVACKELNIEDITKVI